MNAQVDQIVEGLLGEWRGGPNTVTLWYDSPGHGIQSKYSALKFQLLKKHGGRVTDHQEFTDRDGNPKGTETYLEFPSKEAADAFREEAWEQQRQRQYPAITDVWQIF